jgi:hypothetical protein
MNPIQRYIDLLEQEVRAAERRIDDLDAAAQREKIETKIQIYREIGMIRRRKEDLSRKLESLLAGARRTAEVAA